MARYDFSPHLSATLNLDNMTDKKYLTSLYWTQAYYGTPRSGSVSLNWTY
jgi:outer membrane receptor for ferric coprogen and ferric-rhodotorulic acid